MRTPPAAGPPAPHRGTEHRSDRGAVTIEAAIALGSLALVTALAVGAVAATGAAVRCTDAARELARLASRGEPDRGRAVAAQLAPPGAQIVLTIQGDEATAEVTAAPLRVLPVHVHGRAVAVLEPDPPAAPAALPGRREDQDESTRSFPGRREGHDESARSPPRAHLAAPRQPTPDVRTVPP